MAIRDSGRLPSIPGVGVSIGYQQATIPRTGQINGYGNLSHARATANRRTGRHG